MKQIYLLPFLLLTIPSCNSAIDQTNKSDTKNQITELNGKVFFDYDEMTHYSNPFDEEQILELYERQSKSEIDSFKSGIILGGIPIKVSDTVFINKLESIGFSKRNVNKSKFAEINKLFVEKPIEEWLGMGCINVYRDILIFKKQNKTIGIAKICFGCLANQIRGTGANTDNFGQNGDYRRLDSILYNH